MTPELPLSAGEFAAAKGLIEAELSETLAVGAADYNARLISRIDGFLTRDGSCS